MVHRDFRGSARDSLASRPSNCEKHLEVFFTFLSLSVLAASPGDLLATHFSREKRVFCISKTVFKSFQFSLELFMTIHFLSQLNLTQTLCVTLYKLHCCICSPPNLQEKRYGFLFSHLISRILSFIFVCICVGVLIFCYGFVSMFLGLFLFGLLKVLFLCKLVSVDSFIYFLVFVFLR